MSEDERGGREITGRHVFIGFAAAFGVVIAVNLTMMVLAIGGFPGLVSDNPYTEGQRFDAELRAERALGWRIGADWEDGAGRLAISIADATGAPVEGLIVTATVGRPTTASEDRALPLRPEGARHVAELDLAPGRWRVAIEAERASDGATYTIVDEVFVPKGDGA